MNTHPTTETRETPLYVFVERPRCPQCGSIDHKSIRSAGQDDGTRRRRVQCKDCGRKFVIVFE